MDKLADVRSALEGESPKIRDGLRVITVFIDSFPDADVSTATEMTQFIDSLNEKQLARLASIAVASSKLCRGLADLLVSRLEEKLIDKSLLELMAQLGNPQQS